MLIFGIMHTHRLIVLLSSRFASGETILNSNFLTILNSFNVSEMATMSRKAKIIRVQALSACSIHIIMNANELILLVGGVTGPVLMSD